MRWTPWSRASLHGGVALAFALVALPETSLAQIVIGGKFIKEVDPPAPGHYYVSLLRATPDDEVNTLSFQLADEYSGEIRIIYTRGFRVEMSEEDALSLSRDPRVEIVADYPIRGPEPPAHQFLQARAPGAGGGQYTVWLAETPHRFEDARVKSLAKDLAAEYGGEVAEARAFSLGRPHFSLRATGEVARRMADDQRVHHVAEVDQTLLYGDPWIVEPLTDLLPDLPRGYRCSMRSCVSPIVTEAPPEP